MHSKWTARRTRRCSARSTCSYDRQSCQERSVPGPNCPRRANSQCNSVFPGPLSSRLSNSFLLKAIPSARKAREPTSRPIFLNHSRAIRGRRKRQASVAQTAALPSEPGGFLDVTSQNDERPFNLGRTLVDARTAELWRKLSARSLRSFGRQHLGYADPHGMLELRRSVCDYLQAARAVRCEPEQVVITAGTQQALDIVIRVMQGPDKEVWIEDPGYSLTRLVLVAAGVKVCPIPVDQHGINVAEGIRRAPKARAVFITPSHQFPKGVALSMARRLELLAWARESGAWIVEDDYASEFRYGGRPLASLQGLDEAERVIYIGTLNKALVSRTSARLRRGASFTGAGLRDHALSDGPPAIEPLPGGRHRLHGRGTLRSSHPQNAPDVPQPAGRTGRSARRRLGDHLTVDPPDQGMHLVAYTRRGLSDVRIERTARRTWRRRSCDEPPVC